MYYPTRPPPGQSYQVGERNGRVAPAGGLSAWREDGHLEGWPGPLAPNPPWADLLLLGEGIVLGSKLFKLF